MSSAHSDDSSESLGSNCNDFDAYTASDFKHNKLEHFARLLGISKDSLQEHIDVSDHDMQEADGKLTMRRSSCVSSIHSVCSGSVLESIPEEEDMSHEEEESQAADDQSAASSIPSLPSTITTATSTMPRRSFIAGKPPLIPASRPATPTSSAAGKQEGDIDYDNDDDGEEEDLSGVSLLIEDLYPDAFDAAPSRTASRDDDSTNGSVDAPSVCTAETDGDASNKSKPDPPESPVEAAKLLRRGCSPNVMDVDDTLEVTPIIGNRDRRGSTESVHIDDVFLDKDIRLLGPTSGTRERTGTLESMEVYIPDDFDDVDSNLSSCGVSDYQKHHQALIAQFLASPDLNGPGDEEQAAQQNKAVRREQHQDSEGNRIAEMIEGLKNRLAEIDVGIGNDADATETISGPSSKKSTISDATSIHLLNMVKDLKLELADINMHVDSYRMKQRHLTEENALLSKQKARLEDKLQATTKDRDELRSELKMTICIMSAEQKKLREAQVAQTRLQVELEASQSRLFEASKSEKKANLTIKNIMQHRRNSSDTEIFNFDPVLRKQHADDDCSMETQTATYSDSRRSIYSSSMSTFGSESRQSFSSRSTPPPRGLYRIFSNIFNNSSEDVGAVSSSVSSSRHQHCRRHSDEGLIRCAPTDEDGTILQCHSTAGGSQKRRPSHMRRASTGGGDYYGSKATSSIIGNGEEGYDATFESTQPIERRLSINTHNVSTCRTSRTIVLRSIYFVFPSLFYLSFCALFIFLISWPSLYFAFAPLLSSNAICIHGHFNIVCVSTGRAEFLGQA